MSDSVDWFFTLFLGSFVVVLGTMLISVTGLPLNLTYAVIIFAAVLMFPAVFGYASRPSKSQKQVKKAEKEKEKAERKARKYQKEKEEAGERAAEAEKEAEEERRKRERAEQSVEERQANLSEEISRKAREKAEELAEDLVEEKMEAGREQLREQDRLRKQAVEANLRNRAEQEIEEERKKFRELSEIVIGDEELLDVLWSGPINEERFKVIFRASEDPELRRELESIREVNGDVDLWIERKAQELAEEEAGEEPEEKATETTTREGKTQEEQGIDPSELFSDVEPDESELSEKEKYFKHLEEEEFSTTQNDIIRCASKGINNSRKIAQKLNLNPDTIRRNYKPLREEELLETGRKGVSLTERGRQFAEHLA